MEKADGVEKKVSGFQRELIFRPGLEKEPLAIKLLEERMGVTVIRKGIKAHPLYGWDISGSPDGIIDQGLGILVEVKCPFKMMYDAPKMGHVLQCITNMEIWNLEKCYYVVYMMGESGFRVWEIPRQERFFKIFILPEIRRFKKAIVKRTGYKGASKDVREKMFNELNERIKKFSRIIYIKSFHFVRPVLLNRQFLDGIFHQLPPRIVFLSLLIQCNLQILHQFVQLLQLFLGYTDHHLHLFRRELG